jgi:hypothetical protein
MAQETRPRPYWLDEGDETCETCHHGMVVQVVIRCSGCDAAGCDQCIVTVWESREALCADCRAQKDEE